MHFCINLINYQQNVAILDFLRSIFLRAVLAVIALILLGEQEYKWPGTAMIDISSLFWVLSEYIP